MSGGVSGDHGWLQYFTDMKTPFLEKQGGLGPAYTASAGPTAPPTLGFALLLAMGPEETDC